MGEPSSSPSKNAVVSPQPSSQFLCGDLVIHPTRDWPWLGTIHPKMNDLARLCRNCGGLCNPEGTPDAHPHCLATVCDACGREVWKPEFMDTGETEGIAAAVASPSNTTEDIFVKTIKYCEKMMNLGAGGQSSSNATNESLPVLQSNVSKNVAEGETANNCRSKKWQVSYFPAGEMGDLDGSEEVVIPFRQRSMFQEGNPVSNKEKTLVGLVKQVHRRLDAFVLPDYKNVIPDVSAERLLPLAVLEQSPGCYVIYKGWVGTLFNVYNRIHFRLSNGTEFYVDDDESERISVHIKENGKKFCGFDVHQAFPGEHVKLRWCLLDKANWSDGRTEPPVDLKEKIEKSREKFSKEGQSSATYDESMDMDFEKFSTDLEHSNLNSTVMKKVAQDFIQSVVRNLNELNANNNTIQAKSVKVVVETPEEWTSAVIVKIEPIKIDVEWISQVVTDPQHSEPSMKSNYLAGDELQNVATFRACRAYESFDLGSRYKLKVEKSDQMVIAEDWRKEMAKNGNLCDLALKPNHVDGYVYVAVCLIETKVDVLWENGVFETQVDPNLLSAQYCHPIDRDYFPAMYVLLQDPSTVTTKMKHLPENLEIDQDSAELLPTFSRKGVVANKFGVIRKSCNAEKYATVDWYAFSGDSQTEPVKIKTEDVSFYDLKFYHEFNYVGGTLVSMTNPKCKSTPNVGYVRRKNPDGSVAVVWYDGLEETTQPWHLKQLNNRMYYSEYSASDGENDHYYSPTEHEYEDLEDFRYYDYSNLSDTQRNKRVALIVVLLQEVIPRLVRAVVLAHRYFSTLDRRKFVKLTLSTNDVTNGFAQMPEFRDCLKEIYDNEAEVSREEQKKHAWINKNVFREEKLVWQCANFLYDWTEAMATLQEDIRKEHYRILNQAKILKSANSPFGYSDPNLLKELIENEMEEDLTFTATMMEVDDPINMEIVELLRSIETGLSTVTGILAVPSSNDVTTNLILDFVGNCRRENAAKMDASPSVDEVVHASLASSHSFLLKLVYNSGKTSRLPCFSFAHRSDQDLSDLRDKWNIQSFRQGRLQPNSPDSIMLMENDSAAVIVEQTSAFIESILDGRREISCRDDNILQLCNEIADGMCLSVLSILHAIVAKIGERLKKDIDGLFQTNPPSNDEDPTSGPVNEDKTSHDAEVPSISDTATENDAVNEAHQGCFELLPTAPPSHRFITKTMNSSSLPKSFFSAVRREIHLLQTSLPPGIFVKSYEDRMDLFSCMIVGPQGTPYADGLFFFDVRLRDDYPNRPPHAFFKSMSKCLNPNLYEDGMVCLSLLGTWDGKEVELWSPTSTLLQVFVSIQSLILVSEPYYNEPGYEKEKGTLDGTAKSRDYNESAVLRTLESMKRVLASPPEPFREDIYRHVKGNGKRLLHLLEVYQQTESETLSSSFPLFPVTQGFCLCIKRHAVTLLEAIETFMAKVEKENVDLV